VLSDAAFCLVLPGVRLTQTTLMDAMHSGCIPVVAIDSLVLPFSEVLDWNRFSVRIFEHELKDVMRILGKISDTRLAEMSSQLRQTYQRHFSSMAAITRTTLDILNDRLFQHHSKTYFDWNAEKLKKPSNPLLMPKTPPAEDGFTAVILTYDRLESLFTVMTRVAETPSLAQILVVWNNQEVDPPPAAEWPKLPKPFQVLSICDLY
jgi:glucuronyl/N-acetylglucosaminyl transferase EXT2